MHAPLTLPSPRAGGRGGFLENMVRKHSLSRRERDGVRGAHTAPHFFFSAAAGVRPLLGAGAAARAGRATGATERAPPPRPAIRSRARSIGPGTAPVERSIQPYVESRSISASGKLFQCRGS